MTVFSCHFGVPDPSNPRAKCAGMEEEIVTCSMVWEKRPRTEELWSRWHLQSWYVVHCLCFESWHRSTVSTSESLDITVEKNTLLTLIYRNYFLYLLRAHYINSLLIYSFYWAIASSTRKRHELPSLFYSYSVFLSLRVNTNFIREEESLIQALQRRTIQIIEYAFKLKNVPKKPTSIFC